MSSTRGMITLSGRVATDVKVGVVQGKKGESKIVKFSIPERSPGKDAEGNYKPSKAWYSITCFGYTADFVEREVAKGSHVLVTGRMNVDAYSKKDGGEPMASIFVTASDVQVLDKKESYNNPALNSADTPASTNTSNGGGGYSLEPRTTTGKQNTVTDTGEPSGGENW